MTVTKKCEISDCENDVISDRDYCVKHRNNTKCPNCQQRLKFPNSYSGVITCPICKHETHTPTYKGKNKTVKTANKSKKQRIREFKGKNRSSSPHKMNFETMVGYGFENLKANILTLLIPIPFFMLAIPMADEDELLSGLLILLGSLLFLMAFMGITTKIIADAVSYSIYENSKEK
tara:strand:- start:128 stop:655 length:528 start_codon:yes stop_codon:yes gene_type:complete